MKHSKSVEILNILLIVITLFPLLYDFWKYYMKIFFFFFGLFLLELFHITSSISYTILLLAISYNYLQFHCSINLYLEFASLPYKWAKFQQSLLWLAMDGMFLLHRLLSEVRNLRFQAYFTLSNPTPSPRFQLMAKCWTLLKLICYKFESFGAKKVVLSFFIVLRQLSP